MFSRPNIIVALLLVIFFFLGLGSFSRKCTTFDELQHLTAGYSYWLNNDYRLNPENGALPQRLAALPLVFQNVAFPSREQKAWLNSNVLEIGYQFFYEAGNDADLLLLSGRVLMALQGVALGFIVYLWSARLFGRQGGILSLTLFAFSPTLLANSPLITSDVALTLFLTWTVWAFWNLLHRPTWKNAAFSVIGMAGLFLSKFSAPVVLPIIALLLLFFLLRARQRPAMNLQKALGMTVLHIAIVMVAVWACYGFRYSAFSPATSISGQQFFEPWENLQPVHFKPVIDAAQKYHLLPESYLYGFATVLEHGQGRRAFLNGNYSLHGWWYFFPYSFLVKTPVPVLIILILSLLAGLAKWKYLPAPAIREDIYELSPLLILLAVYWTFAIASSLNIGHRHILPVYPALFILAGGAVGLWNRAGHVFRFFLAAMVVWLVAETLIIYPDFLSYFNQFAGGPRNGYRHMVDSSLDWGQDLPALRERLEHRRTKGAVYLSYFGTGSPRYYKIEAQMLPSYIDFRPAGDAGRPWGAGLYCISATMLQSVYSYAAGHWSAPYERAYQSYLQGKQTPNRDFYLRQLRFARLCAYLRHRPPDDTAGNSILLFDLTEDDLQKALLGPPAELVPAVDIR